jgi:hypothetical protein
LWVQERFDLAMEAVQSFDTGVTEDFLLKEEQFKSLRDRLFKSAGEFYGKLGRLLKDARDRPSRQALLRANFELAVLTAKVGRFEDVLAAHHDVLAARGALAAEPGADAAVNADVGRSLTAIATLLEAMGNSDETVAAHRRAELLLAGTATSDPEVRAALAACRARLGYLLGNLGAVDAARVAHEEAPADRRTSKQRPSWPVAWTCSATSRTRPGGQPRRWSPSKTGGRSWSGPPRPSRGPRLIGASWRT